MRALHITAVIALAIVFCCSTALAQEKMMEKKMDFPKNVPGSFLKQSKFVEGQFMQLAEAIPQEKYSWRPEEGVRSIAESFLHAALGNYLVMKTLGGQVPAGVDVQKLEKSTTDKKQVVEELKKSFQAVNEYIASIPESDYSTEVDFFGTKMTKLDIIFVGATHQHEVLGQAVAYSRTNHIAPPWTVARQAKMKKQ